MQIGQTVIIENRKKKSVVEYETWVDEDGNEVNVESLWRWGSAAVTINTQRDLDLLTEAAALDDDDEWHVLRLSELSEFEGMDLSDNCGADIDDDDVSYGQLTVRYDLDSIEYEIYGPIDIEEEE